MAIYLMCLSDEAADAAFRKAWMATGKKLDMGKCCIRFKKLEDLALELIGKKIQSMTAREFVRFYEQSRSKPAAKASPTKTARKAVGQKSGKSA